MPVGEGMGKRPWEEERQPLEGGEGANHGKGEQAPKYKYDRYLTGISSPVTSSTNSFENTCQVTCQCEEIERWVGASSFHIYKILQQDC